MVAIQVHLFYDCHAWIWKPEGSSGSDLLTINSSTPGEWYFPSFLQFLGLGDLEECVS